MDEQIQTLMKLSNLGGIACTAHVRGCKLTAARQDFAAVPMKRCEIRWMGTLTQLGWWTHGGL